MGHLGYALSSEEHGPNQLVSFAKLAEDAGFDFAFISDHYHPWVYKQGNSPFVWAVIGGISRETKRIKLSTGVTCPIMRIHPAIIAQAAATAQIMMTGRFMLGIGTGENLNEHILGDKWPPIEIRQQMVEEAIYIIKTLWEGNNTTIYGEFFTVEDARVYSLPDTPPPILMAAAGENSALMAGKIAEGLVSTSTNKKVINAFEKNAGKKAPKYGQIAVCYDTTKEKAEDIAFEYWPNAAVRGQLGQELRIPAYFEQAVKMVTKEDVSKAILCSPDKNKYIDRIQEFFDAGFTDVYLHQIGPKQEEFIEFMKNEVLPEFN